MKRPVGPPPEIVVPSYDPKTTSRLILVVDFEGRINDSEIEEIIDKAREHGGITLADYYTLAPTKYSFR